MRIALAGFMAVGKSTIGKRLAEQLSLKFVDLDREIEHRTGLSIPELFNISEDFFRRKEEETLKSLLNQDDIVLALGGGTLHFGENAKWVAQYFQVYTLQASWKNLEQRILASDRPLAKESRALFQRRKQGYSQIGAQIDTNEKEPEQVLMEIMMQMNRQMRLEKDANSI